MAIFNMKLKGIISVVIIVFTTAAILSAEEKGLWEGNKPEAGKYDIGIIFNTTDVLLNIESYQGGVGMKIGGEKITFRFMLDLLINTDLSPFSISAEVALEKHFISGLISPYWGGLMEVGYTSLTNKVDADNWTQAITIPLSLGGIFGIELFIFEFLSLFVEYNLKLSLALNISKSSLAGAVSTTNEYTYNLNLGMGNNSMIGIVIYLTRRQ